MLEYDFIDYIEHMFDLRVVIWTKRRKEECHRTEFQLLYTGFQGSTKEVLLHFQEETGCFLLISDEKSYFKDKYWCKNRNRGCYFQFESKALLDHHEILCCGEKIKIVQTEMGPNQNLIRKAEESGLIPKTEIHRDFLFFDIESVLPKSTVKTKKNTVLSTHSLVSIAVNR